jgi:type IV pilus assembly protein PilZ
MGSDQEGAPIELQLDYQRLNTFFADYVKNISRGGTFVGTRKPLPVGTHFVFVLGVPQLEAPLRFDGKVMWVTSTEDASKANPAGMGIEIEYATEEEKNRVKRGVEALMREELGEKLTQRLLGD